MTRMPASGVMRRVRETGVSCGGLGKPVDGRVQHVGDRAWARARRDDQIQLDELTALLLVQRSHLAEGPESIAHLRPPEVADGASRMNPRAEAHVAAESAIRLLQIERGVRRGS